jgi:tetratricopeptide (TPR) repeat protein
VASGKLDAAAAALSDALTLDPLAADARMARARLRLDAGDIPGAFLDTQALIDAYPKAQQPWDLRVEIAERVARPDLALSALDASTRLWPSDATAWLKLGLLLRQRGDSPERARQALERARSLSPSLSLPGQQPD